MRIEPRTDGVSTPKYVKRQLRARDAGRRRQPTKRRQTVAFLGAVVRFIAEGALAHQQRHSRPKPCVCVFYQFPEVGVFEVLTL